MTTKLIKHEFIAMGRTVPLIYAGALLAALVNRFYYALDIDYLNSISYTSFAIAFAGIFATPLLTLVFVVRRYYRSTVGREGFLTAVLPVAPNKIFISKVISGYIWMLGSVIASFFIIFVLFGLNDIPLFSKMLTNLFDAIKENLPTFLLIITAGAAYLFNAMMSFYFSVTMSASCGLRKFGAGGAVIVYVIYYFASQIISSIAIAAPMMSFDISGNAFFAYIALYQLIISSVFILVTRYLFEYKASVR